MQNTIEQAEARAAAMRASWCGETVITRLGAAVVVINRLCRQIPALNAADRAVVRELLAELMTELDQTARSAFGDALVVQKRRP